VVLQLGSWARNLTTPRRKLPAYYEMFDRTSDLERFWNNSPKKWNKEMKSGTSAFVISSFRRAINKIFALVECYVEFTGS